MQNLYQILLEVYLCQHWIVEFKGIMQPVLFMIVFSDFVTPQKPSDWSKLGHVYNKCSYIFTVTVSVLKGLSAEIFYWLKSFPFPH